MLFELDPVEVPVTRGLPDPLAGDERTVLAADPLGTSIAVPEPTLGAEPLLMAMADEPAAAEEPTVALPLGKPILPAAADEEDGAETVIHCTEQELLAGTLDTFAKDDDGAILEDANVGDPLLAGTLDPSPTDDGDATL